LSEAFDARKEISTSEKPTYEHFFGLNCPPFHLSPDPFFMISSEKSNEAMASIAHAIHQRKGFVVLTGEVGTGKTLVLRCLSELWKRDQIPFAYFMGATLSTVDFLSYITSELGINVTEPTKVNLLRALYGFLQAQSEKGLTTVLIIDEAHRMRRSILEEIGVLSNFETFNQKLVQIVLVGQPELEKKLELVELRSLRQRIAVRCQLEPLREEEIRNYIERRLELAGAGLQATTIFPTETVKAICRHSRGIPRLVNRICDQALITACARQVRVVPAEVIKEVSSHLLLAPVALASEFISRPAFRPAIGETVASTADLRGVAQPNQSLSDTGRSQTLSYWLRPSLRLAIILGAVAVVPAVLSTGVFMEPRQESVALPHQVIGTGETFPARLTDTSTQSAGAGSAVPIDFDSEDTVVVHADIASSNATGEQLTPRTKIVTGTLSRPVLKLPPLSPAIEPPPIVGIQTKELDRGKGLLDNSVSAPASPETNIGSHLEPPTEVRAKDLEPGKGLLSTSALAAPSPGADTSGDGQSQLGIQTKELDRGKGLLGTSVPAPAVPGSNIGSHLEPPKLVSSPVPNYPSVARLGNVGGPVLIDAVVDETGRVTDTKAISGNLALRRAAMEGLRMWKYEPARLNGQPTAAHIQVRIVFRP
jgi:general secretion pathway protein A